MSSKDSLERATKLVYSDEWLEDGSAVQEIAAIAKLLDIVRLGEAKLIRANWNVAEEIRSFNHWIDNHIAELEMRCRRLEEERDEKQ